MLASDFEQFDGEEIVCLDVPTLLLIFQGRLAVTRQVSYFGIAWQFDVLGAVAQSGLRAVLLPPGNYSVKGKAFIYYMAEEVFRKNNPPLEKRQLYGKNPV